MTAKDKLIKTIREVPIASKTYEEYVDALADHLLANSEVIPIAVLKRKILGIDLADQCDQAGRWSYQLRNAINNVLEWYGCPDYKECLEHTKF